MEDTPVDPTAEAADATDATERHETARLRGPKRLLRWGPVVALVGALGSGLLGAGGSEGAFVLLLLLAATFGATGLWVGAALLVDEFRGAPTSWRRGALAAGMFLAALLCMTAVGGVATELGSGT